MADIVQELRERQHDSDVAPLLIQAADEIERLRKIVSDQQGERLQILQLYEPNAINGG